MQSVLRLFGMQSTFTNPPGNLNVCYLDLICANLTLANRYFTILSLSQCNVGNDTIKKLAQALEGNVYLEQLELNNCGITDISPLTETLRRNACNLRSLIVCRNTFGNEQAYHIAHMLMENTTLRVLSLTWTSCDMEGLLCIVRSLSFNSTLEILSIDDMLQISDVIYRGMVIALRKNATLRKLRIRSREVSMEDELCCYDDNKKRKIRKWLPLINLNTT